MKHYSFTNIESSWNFAILNSRLNWCIFQVMMIHNECKSYIIPLRIFLIIKSYPWKMNNYCTLHFFLPLRLNRLKPKDWVFTLTSYLPRIKVNFSKTYCRLIFNQSKWVFHKEKSACSYNNSYLWIWLLMKITLMPNMSMQK